MRNGLSNGVDPSGNNDASESTPVTGGPDLVITKDDGAGTASAGQTLIYTITVDNVGTRGASGVTISDDVPTGTTFDAANSTAGWSCSDGDPAGTTCTFSLGTVEVADAPDAVAFAVTVDDPVASGIDDIDNTATVADDGANGTDPAGNNADDDVNTLDAAPDLAIDKDDGGATVTPGSNITYTMTVTNDKFVAKLRRR